MSCAAGAAWSLRGVSALLRSRLPELRAGLSVCFRTEPQSSVSPEQLLREIFCRPQKCGCFKGTCWVLIPLEGWGGKEKRIKGFGDDCGPYWRRTGKNRGLEGCPTPGWGGIRKREVCCFNLEPGGPSHPPPTPSPLVTVALSPGASVEPCGAEGGGGSCQNWVQV